MTFVMIKPAFIMLKLNKHEEKQRLVNLRHYL
jgi:hypothetical protein